MSVIPPNHKYKTTALHLLIALSFLCMLYPGVGWAAQPGRPKIPSGSFGCTSSVNKFEKWSKGYGHAAVAIAKAKTITGSRGCGYAWHKKSKSIAERVALANCRKFAFHPETCSVAKSN